MGRNGTYPKWSINLTERIKRTRLGEMCHTQDFCIGKFIRRCLGFNLFKNEIIKGPAVASVVRFGWWTASDFPKDLTFQLWLKISEKYQKPD